MEKESRRARRRTAFRATAGSGLLRFRREKGKAVDLRIILDRPNRLPNPRCWHDAFPCFSHAFVNPIRGQKLSVARTALYPVELRAGLEPKICLASNLTYGSLISARCLGSGW